MDLGQIDFLVDQGYYTNRSDFICIAIRRQLDSHSAELNLLIQNNEFQRAWDLYESLPEHFSQSDRIQIILGVAAIELDKDLFMESLLNTEFAVIREGEVQIIDLWYKHNAKKLAIAQNVELSLNLIEEAKNLFPPPTNIDFRVLGA